jgi:hypothetical protein
MMEGSNLPIHSWFLAMHLMTSTKKPLSALEVQKQIGSKRYEPVWYMMQKIRIAMGKRDKQYLLQGEIEIDDAFFEVVDLPVKDELGNRKEEQKRGRGSQRQAKILIMVESRFNPEQDGIHKKKRAMGYVKMRVMDNLSNQEINYVVGKSLDPTSKVITDAWRGYSRLHEVVEEHTAMIVPGEEAPKKLPWVHTVIANAKRQILGVHHSVNKEFIQNYLDEYCYKLNRRYFTGDLFESVLRAGISNG